MSAGKTSRAAHHLRVIHHLQSPKSDAELSAKRKREAEVEVFRASPLITKNPARLNMLLETLRIINHNLPLRVGEYDESRLLQELAVKREMKAVVNAKRVKEAIIELFRSTKAEVSEYLADDRENYPNFTIVADFWTCKVTHNKFLGIRVYLIDKEWKFNSIILGTKQFDPVYSDRVGGIGKPFRMSLTKMLESFGLTITDFYGATSDSGGDVKRMLRSELKLNWEWCFAHMAHAATKASCGVGGKKVRAANHEMAELITKMTLVITQVKLVSSAGKLFAELCKAKTKGASTRLVGYTTSRFLSTTNAMRRVLDKWPAIVAWYEERGRQALRDRKPPPLLSSCIPSNGYDPRTLNINPVEEQPIASRANLSRLEARFVPHAARPVIASRVDRRGEDELDRWLDDPIGVLRNDDMIPNESVLEFWQRLKQSGEYPLIPKAVHVLFSIPSSSCQLERDFSVSGEMVSPQRSSLAGENIDMCIFLNRNSEFVNLLQCEEIPRGQYQQYIPPSIGFDLDPYIFMDDIDSSILAEFVSSPKLSDLEDKEQKSSQ
ncbi:unnamed protein product [Phytophthora fragariaefolia]|uniref:Unnamed protein product n=1 Tax=Phytophthora fragariaefolia TaxID=1490495 RepID=A0A9W7CZX8_9STRA|nr:unnamed protein product [Phytophthora fragariaefolia]